MNFTRILIAHYFQAHRLQKAIYDEIGNKLKLIDTFRATASSASKIDRMQIAEQKNHIAEMLKMLSHLKLCQFNIQQISIDSILDWLTHTFNAISAKDQAFSCAMVKGPNATAELIQPLREEVSSVYLNEILRKCDELNTAQSEETVDDIEGVIRDTVWPEIMQRLNNCLDSRKKIKVDLSRLSSEEKTMVENVGNEMVSDIVDKLM